MNYSRFVTLAINQIKDKGRTVTLRSKSDGVFDPLTSDFVDGTVTDRTPKALFTEYKSKDIDGSVIVRGDKMVLIADMSAPPDTNDVLIDGDEQYAIVNVGAIQPGDTPILYKLQVRR